MDEEKITLQQIQAAEEQQEFDILVQSVPETTTPDAVTSAPKSEVKKPVMSASEQKTAAVKKKKKKKKKKRRKSAARIIGNIVRTVFLVAFLLCLAVIGLGIYMYLGMSSDSFKTDSVSKIIYDEGLSVAERFEIDANARTAKMRMDVADVWYLIDKEYGEDYVEDLKDKFNEKGFRLSGYGLVIDEYDPSIDLDIRWNSLKIQTHMLCDIGFDDGTLTITPTGIRIAKVHLSPKQLKLLTKIDLSEYVFSVKTAPAGFIRSFDKMTVEDDTLVFDVSLDPGFLKAISSDQAYMEKINWYCDGYTAILDAASMYEADPDAALTAFLKPAEKKASELERLLNEFYTLADPSFTKAAFKGSNAFVLDRILAGNKTEGYTEAHENIVSYCDERQAMVDELVMSLAEAWDSGSISINSESRFIYKKDYLNVMLFAPEENPWDNYELFVPAEGFKYVLIDSESAYIDKTPKLKKLSNKNAVYGIEGVNRDVPYGLGVIYETANGYRLLSYVSFVKDADGNIPEEGGIFCVTTAVDDELYKNLTAEGVVNVFSDRVSEEPEPAE